MPTDTVISHFVIRISLIPLSCYYGSQRMQSKQAAAGTTMDITLKIPETLEIIWRAGSPTSQCIIMAAYKMDC
jgi:hypothetical protein